ncbi:potassium ABC transporter ATPase [Methylobacterium platani]|uniref:Adenine nucleotide alpha hydrolase n=2 Tax=Methylobacterium platani TaxID=427683 RepID=A0A179S3T6_9HYPH|nr:potassium ABC transporter ATPase [Methylobacterium platani]KMO22575.1 potassium ABC transporter ATPase [Methylobacterium platani JCM 14648]OAS20152.1 adenine nucleotide alpha hydrolase [Methylobacterium platani]
MSAALEHVLSGLGPIAVAVSGGVDSLTLATIAHRTAPEPPLMVHAVSPAVPGEATARVRAEAAREGWTLRVIEAGEFADPAYRENPVNRCFFCKTNLYGAIRQVTGRRIVSGANLDDLGEYRPGLDAAREHGVRHPFVEAGFSKAMVRALARDLGLGAVAELPAAPCLSSRVETGIRIEPETLSFIHAVERLVGDDLTVTGAKSAVRCRVRAAGIVVELDAASLAGLTEPARLDLGRRIAERAPARLAAAPVSFAPYRTGSAFLVGNAS